MNVYRFSADANRDVAGIVDLLFKLNPVAARNFLNSLESTCGLLAAHSGIGRLRPELGEGVRSMPIGNYLVSTFRQPKALMWPASSMADAICPRPSVAGNEEAAFFPCHHGAQPLS